MQNDQGDQADWGDHADHTNHSHWIEYERCSDRTVKYEKLPISSFDEWVSQWLSSVQEMLAHIWN